MKIAKSGTRCFLSRSQWLLSEICCLKTYITCLALYGYKAHKRSDFMQNVKSKYPHIQKSNSPISTVHYCWCVTSCTTRLIVLVSQYLTTWSISISDSQLNEKKRKSSPNVSLILPVYITKWDEKEKEGGWQQLGVLNMNTLSHTQQPVSYKQGNWAFSHHMWKCGSLWIW